jgi:glycosyltransferase involved in cell wall biosynthesis
VTRKRVESVADAVSGESVGISVCMATYNGQRFVRQQIESIVLQLSPTDELVVVDDASSDTTCQIIEEFRDPRIRLHRNETNIGVVKTFERALRLAQGELIFLSDQDDIWREDKVATIKREFESNPRTTLVMSDATILNAEGKALGRWNDHLPFHPSIPATLLRNTYVGCLMAFRRTVVAHALPFPYRIPMHDMWIGLVNRFVGKTEFIDEPLVFYRRHSGTLTGERATVPAMILRRSILAWHLLARICRLMGRDSRKAATSK